MNPFNNCFAKTQKSDAADRKLFISALPNINADCSKQYFCEVSRNNRSAQGTVILIDLSRHETIE